MPEIVLIEGTREILRRKLDSDVLTLGRGEGNTIRVDDPRVSRSHARISPRGQGYVFLDVGSSYGSFLGDQRIEERLLADGDTIRIGDRFLTYVAKDGAGAPGAAPAVPPAARGHKTDFHQLQTMFLSPDSGVESVRRLEALFEISRALENAQDFESVLREILDKAITIMQAERGFLMLRDGDTGELTVHVARNKEGDVLGVDADAVGHSMMRKVAETGEPALIGDAQLSGTQSMISHGIHSALCVPMKNADTVSGVLYVDHRSRGNAFNESDLAFMSVFALQAKVAIDSSKAYWQLVESLFAASEDFVFVCGRDRRILRANRAAERLLGGAQRGRFDELFAETDRIGVVELCQTTLEKGVSPGRDFTLTPLGSASVPANFSSFALRDPAGQATGFCAIGRDLTRLQALVSSLQSANAQLKELNEMKSQLVGMIAHEIKSPISVVMGYVDLLLLSREMTDDKHRDHLKRIQQAGERLVELIQELLDLTHIETGQAALEIRPVRLATVVEPFARIHELKLKEKNIRLELDIPADLPDLQADERLLARSLENLFTNGIKYNRDGGRLLISAAAENGDVRIRVSDEGIGMTADDLTHVFERFFRAPDARKRSIPGTGLGLSIVKAVAERHGGTVKVESEPGKGTAFTMLLPLTPPPPPLKADDAAG